MFALVAVFLTCLGLVALVSFTVERRDREIGIRKALGASVRRLLAMLFAEFVALVLIANAVAWPAAWLIMNRWLEDYSYRVEVGWDIFFFSRRRSAADHPGHHRVSRNQDRVGQPRGRFAKRVKKG